MTRQKKLLTVPRVSDKKRCWSYDRLRSAFTKKGFVEIEPEYIVFDVGAHVGVFSIVAAKNADHVIAVDPNASVNRCLYINTKEYPNISVINKAAWKESTELELKKGYFPSENSSLDVDSYDLQETFTVKANTVSQIASDQDIDAIDFLKVEAEGAEPEILEGALSDGIRVNKVAVDCSPERFGENTHGQVIPILKKYGYDISIKESNPSYVFGRKPNDLR